MIAAAILVAASAVVFYILIGYPAILALRKGRLAPPVRKDLGFRTSVSVILAVYNGEEFIRAKLESLLRLRYPKDLLEILIVSDGSTDRTNEIAAAYEPQGVRLLRLARGGKAAAINAGLKQTSGEIIFFTDVRQALDPDALSHLVANFADPSVGAVTGELRFLNQGVAGEQADMDLYWRYELWARRRHCEIDSILGATGCIYALRRSLAEPIPPDTLSDDVVIPLRVFFRGFRVICDPAAIALDYRTADGAEFRRKLRTLAGLWQAHARTPQLFTRANRMRFHFLSHKFVRLALPWAILTAWLATIALPPSQVRSLLLSVEVIVVVLALIDRVLPRKFLLKRVTSPARTFMAMNAAALLAVAVFILPPARLWGRTRVEIRA